MTGEYCRLQLLWGKEVKQVSNLPAGRHGFQRLKMFQGFNAFKWFESKRHNPPNNKQQTPNNKHSKPQTINIQNPNRNAFLLLLHFFVLIQRNEAKKNQAKPDRSARFAL